ncbi:putative uncharacterized protein [Dorea formicigenerans CAG:28]|nr:putative uncharacterized protein [Dorea formicigenerans CAG:28]
MNEQLARMTLDWSEERFDEEGELLTRSNMAMISLRHFEDWGWLRRDYDETLNSYVVSFPEYSQLYVELFRNLYSDEDSKERESVLAVYSHLYTYSSDREKNNDILKSALHTSRSLLQMLANMQEGMRGYFDELSSQRSFLGIQEVLVKEINNSDSQKYAILTTTDSFYRYKEAVKELIEKNLGENETRREGFVEKLMDIQVQLAREEQEKSEERNVQNKLSIQRYRLERAVKLCDEANEMLYRISREFDAIERRYNMLIEQKTVFASRAAARIRYILMEGAVEEDQTIAFVNLLTQSEKRDEILDKLSQKMKLTEPYRVMNEKSLYQRRDRKKEAFVPQAVTEVTEQADSEEMNEYVLKPLYTQKEIREFRKQNEQDGNFIVTKDTVKSMEDLEKLFLVWQDATEVAEGTEEIEVGEELENEIGLRFSKLVIKKSQ